MLACIVALLSLKVAFSVTFWEPPALPYNHTNRSLSVHYLARRVGLTAGFSGWKRYQVQVILIQKYTLSWYHWFFLIYIYINKIVVHKVNPFNSIILPRRHLSWYAMDICRKQFGIKKKYIGEFRDPFGLKTVWYVFIQKCFRHIS